MRNALALAIMLAFATATLAITAPQHATAGQDVTIQASGTVYISGPGYAAKKKAEGGSVTIKGDELVNAGRYIVSDGESSAVMWVDPADVAKINFFAQPSRVPAAKQNAISATAYTFDRWENLVTKPTPVKFDLSVQGAPDVTRTVESKNGVAWTKTDSSKKEGAANFVVSAGNADVKRVVRQVAGEACSSNLHMTARPDKNGILVETAPIRDCSGNALPDGTIVTFTAMDNKGKTTIDARIRKGVATAMLPPLDNGTISVATGVTLGNEIRWGGGR